jgi:hypothetical protein
MKKAAFQALLSPIIADYRERPYEFWLSRVDGDPIHFDVTAQNGAQCRVEIDAHWDDKPDGDIHVFFSIDDGGWRAFVPVTDSFVRQAN